MADTRVKADRTFSRKIDPLLKTNNDTGFGTSAANYGGRFINRDGTFNVRREGVPFLNRFSIYHSMLSLPMNWTVVHPTDEQSPLQGFTAEDMEASDVEIYVLIRGFDDVYSNFVRQRTSYTYHEIRFDGKFVPMYRESEDGRTTILELHKLNEYIDLKKS